MPAVSLAFQEVERQVAALRQRLNRDALVAALGAPLAALLGLAAVVVAVALRGAPGVFGWTLVGALAALPAVLWAAYTRVRHRWQSLESAARTADRRAPTSDRVATSLWIARAHPDAPFAEVLAADAVAYAGTWRPEWIAPRRFPRPLLLPALALLGLIGAALLPPAPSPPGAQSIDKSQSARREPDSGGAKMEGHALSGVASARRDDQTAAADRRQIASASSRDQPAGGTAEAEAPREPAGANQLPESLPEQVQDLIREALRAEQIERARALLPKGSPLGLLPVAPGSEDGAAEGDEGEHLSGESDPDSPAGKDAGADERQQGAGMPANEARRRKQGEMRRGEQGAGEKIAGSASSPDRRDDASANKRGSEQDASSDSPDPRDQRASQSGTSEARPAGEAKRSDAQNQNTSGGSPSGAPKTGENPRAGSFSAPEGLLSGRENAGNFAPPPGAAPPDARTFKLTLFSFLGEARLRPGKSDSKVLDAAGGSVHREVGALHPEQMADDALRRVDVPPEYQEIVRRIYSARGGE